MLRRLVHIYGGRVTLKMAHVGARCRRVWCLRCVQTRTIHSIFVSTGLRVWRRLAPPARHRAPATHSHAPRHSSVRSTRWALVQIVAARIVVRTRDAQSNRACGFFAPERRDARAVLKLKRKLDRGLDPPIPFLFQFCVSRFTERELKPEDKLRNVIFTRFDPRFNLRFPKRVNINCLYCTALFFSSANHSRVYRFRFVSFRFRFVSSQTFRHFVIALPLKTQRRVWYRRYGIESRSTNQNCPFRKSHRPTRRLDCPTGLPSLSK